MLDLIGQLVRWHSRRYYRAYKMFRRGQDDVLYSCFTRGILCHQFKPGEWNTAVLQGFFCYADKDDAPFPLVRDEIFELWEVDVRHIVHVYKRAPIWALSMCDTYEEAQSALDLYDLIMSGSPFDENCPMYREVRPVRIIARALPNKKRR